MHRWSQAMQFDTASQNYRDKVRRRLQIKIENMAKFIEVTDYNDQSLYISVDNILWIKPYDEENGTIIYLPVRGRNDYPVSLTVKESYAQVTEAIGR